ncbi:hypothetical protein ACT17_14730 [Mycolicibacterium conceptionense]|uniref:Uncharacterized protein n=1 Tax=Mycolicibacterium conceptionense TaxID=451644 RepID=A0A0J8WWZ4_9MYCO|nr:hypothetical protein [Mycolicibacterium conceptionense]KMV17549.1 hypothetical protein ACT17_14730 [Mycolicibacterium conceptionense]
MRITVLITNVYDGAEYTDTVSFDAPPAPRSGDDEAMDDWAYDNIYPHTGDGREHEEAGYFAEIKACDERPDLVGREFEWGT